MNDIELKLIQKLTKTESKLAFVGGKPTTIQQPVWGKILHQAATAGDWAAALIEAKALAMHGIAQQIDAVMKAKLSA